MAEQVGFEPTEDYSAFASLAGRWIKPLSHCSICKWGFRTHAVSHLAPSKDRYDYTMRCVRTPRPMMVGTPMRFKFQGSFTFNVAASTTAGSCAILNCGWYRPRDSNPNTLTDNGFLVVKERIELSSTITQYSTLPFMLLDEVRCVCHSATPASIMLFSFDYIYIIS